MYPEVYDYTVPILEQDDRCQSVITVALGACDEGKVPEASAREHAAEGVGHDDDDRERGRVLQHVGDCLHLRFVGMVLQLVLLRVHRAPEESQHTITSKRERGTAHLHPLVGH